MFLDEPMFKNLQNTFRKLISTPPVLEPGFTLTTLPELMACAHPAWIPTRKQSNNLDAWKIYLQKYIHRYEANIHVGPTIGPGGVSVLDETGDLLTYTVALACDCIKPHADVISSVLLR